MLDFILVQIQTFMNLYGKAARYTVNGITTVQEKKLASALHEEMPW